MSSNSSPTAIKIKELRTNMDLTQKEFAELINVSTVSISSYETGVKTPSLDMIINIAQKCNVSIDWLCGLSDKMTLDHHITTYKDVFKSFVDVLGTTRYQDDEIKPIFQKIDIDKNFDTVLITLQNDYNFHIFLKNGMTYLNFILMELLTRIYTKCGLKNNLKNMTDLLTDCHSKNILNKKENGYKKQGLTPCLVFYTILNQTPLSTLNF